MPRDSTRELGRASWPGLSLLSLALLAACGGDPSAPRDSDPDPLGDPATVPLRGACPLDRLYGGFVVALHPQYSIVDGKIRSGVVPLTVLEPVANEGDCRVLRKPDLFCDPPCAAQQTCDRDGSCIAYPRNQNLGTVNIRGLAKRVQMRPLAPGNNYFDTDLPHPVFEAGQAIRITSTAGHYGELRMHGVGVARLPTLGSPWRLQRGEPLSLLWGAPAAGGRSRVHLKINVDQHGSSPATLICDLDDTGEATIPASVVDALLDAGISGFPNGSLARRTEDSQSVGSGCAEFVVASEVQARVRVGGHTPCDDPGDCPSQQSCDLSTNTCR